MDNLNLKGLGVALVTPFKDDHSVDYKSLEILTEHLVSDKADYLVVLGTTGESPTLSKIEKREICKTVINVNQGRVPVVIGMGSNDTYKLRKRLSDFDIPGISAVLSVIPYYNKPSQEGIFLHFASVAEISPLPIILYNIPGRTGVNMTADTTLRLANNFEKIIGVKEASGNLNQIKKIITSKPVGFEVISGDDMVTLQLMKEGAAGVISVVANLFTKQMRELVSSCLKNDFNSAERIDEKMKPFYKLIFEEGNPAGIKAALSYSGFIKNVLRLPLTPAGDKLQDKINYFIDQSLK